MKKIVLLLSALLALAASIEAKPVSLQTARRVAINFMLRQTGVLTSMEQVSLPSSIKHLYLFANTNGNGYVYVPDDDCAYPILGYSLTSNIRGEVSQAEAEWLQEYSDEIEAAIDEHTLPSPQILHLWHLYSSGRMNELSPVNTPITPLLSTSWSGGQYYNSLCPTDSNGLHFPVGCGAVAMSQVMKYYNWPSNGVGTNSYTDNGNTVYANFGSTTYSWADMPNMLTATSTATQRQAVATLMFHAGVSVNMQYRRTGSSSVLFSDGTVGKKCIENALKSHFKYSKQLHSVHQAAYSGSEWSNLLLTELSASRPVIYRGAEVNGSGHIWVCDGVDADGLFHFNGGGGSTTAYFQVEPIPNHQFPKKCAAIIGIQPETGTTSGSKTIQTTPNQPSYGTTSVALKSQSNNTFQSHSFNSGDTVVIVALATDSTRFMRWSDGFIFNTREEVVDRDITYTAIFEKVAGDTLYYDNGCYVGIGAWHNSAGVYAHFGIKLPPSTTAGHDSLLSVMLYSHYTGSYTVKIHIGETANPNNIVTSQTVNITKSMSWHSTPLNQPVVIDANQPVWILFHPDSSGYSMPFSPSSGNNNGYYTSYNYSSWLTNIGNIKRTWMVRGVFSAYHEPPIHDTIVTHDTIYLHDTVTVTNTIHDTVTVTNTVHDTVMVTNTVHDTITVTNTIHDTIIETQTDTIVVISYDTIVLDHFDTIIFDRTDTVYLFDTIIIHDTVYVNSESIGEALPMEVQVFQRNGKIVVETSNMTSPAEISVYDALGRLIGKNDNSHTATACQFDIPVSGIYFVRVGDLFTRRVVVVR